MSSSNKVAWLESQYLYPHHLQQHDRYIEALIEQRSSVISPFIYGFTQINLNTGKLNEGSISLTNAQGIFPDGTPFNSETNTGLPLPLKVPAHVKNQLLYLALPLYQPGYQFLTTDSAQQDIGRYLLEEIDAYDYSSPTLQTERIETARLQPRFLLESEELGGFTYLPIAKVIEVTTEGAIILDKAFISPVLNVSASSTLSEYLDNIAGLLQQRGNALSARFQNSNNNGGSSAVVDFMLLQLINRYEPQLQHLSQHTKKIHPEKLFYLLLGLMGELATFTTSEKRPAVAPRYNQDDLYNSFQPLVLTINRYLSAVLEQTALSLPVEKRQYGIFVSPISDRTLLSDSRFVLAIKASASTNELKDHLPDHIKIGSVDTIRDLVNNQLTGITLSTLPMAPREITYHAGFVYFELNTDSEQWQSLKKSAGFAIHIAGEFTNLVVEFWAIRN